MEMANMAIPLYLKVIKLINDAFVKKHLSLNSLIYLEQINFVYMPKTLGLTIVSL
jgi:hypothetical protein